MEKIPKITFVMPCWNVAFVLNQTIDSLFEQTVDDIEVIIINDGSTDETESMLSEIDDDRFVIITNEKRMGAGYSRNRGNERAKSNIICVTDCGDVYYPQKAEETIKFFEKNDIDIMCSATDSIAGEPAIKPRLFCARHGEKLGFEHPGVAYKKHVTNNIKYRETSVQTDQYDAFFFDCGLAGYQFATFEHPLSAKCTFDSYTGGRNLDDALMVKYGIYEEYGVPIPEWLKQHKEKMKWKKRI